MRDKRTAGVGAPAAADAPGVGAPYGTPILPHSPTDCQLAPHLQDLIRQAQVKEARAWFAAEIREAAGDLEGRAFFVRRAAAHRAIERSLSRAAGKRDD